MSDFAQQIKESVEAGKKCFGTPEPKLDILPSKGSKPFNWNVTDCIDFKLKLEFTKSFNSALEEIRRDKVELAKWRQVAVQVSADRGDVSTPEKFRAVQLDALLELHNTISRLSQENDKLKALLRDVDISSETSWHSWLFRRDQLVPPQPEQKAEA